MNLVCLMIMILCGFSSYRSYRMIKRLYDDFYKPAEGVNNDKK